MKSNPQSARSLALALLASILVALLWLSACGPQTPTPIIIPPARTRTPAQRTPAQRTPAPPTATHTPTATRTPTATPTPEDFFVAILNRRLTHAQVADEIRREGTLTVGGWNYAARAPLVAQFQKWVQDEYGVPVTLTYDAPAAPADLYQEALDAHKNNAPAPYDVLAIEESFFRDAVKQGAAEKIFPSDLLRNAARVAQRLHAEPYGVAFQSAATIAPVFHQDNIGAWFHDWQDLADPRLKRRITLPAPDDPVIAGAFLMGVASSLGKDYRQPAQMREAIEFVCTQIVPNQYTITNNMNLQQELLREQRVDAVVGWNLLARLEGFSGLAGTKDTVFVPMASGQPDLNGYAWIPKGTSHPVLAQLWLDWRLSNDGQLPSDAWDLSHPAWGEYHEGLLGDSYTDSIPAWLKPNYNNYYPSVSDTAKLYKLVDWDYFAAHQAEWLEQYQACAK